MANVLDLEQSLLLLELEPPFGKREVQLARRRQAKVWHPDIAPPGKQVEHERHLKAINEAADQLESLAEQSRGGHGVEERGPRVGDGRARGARRGRPPRLRGRAARPRARGRQAEARPVRRARARPLRRAQVRALPVLSGVGRRDGRRHLLHRRGRRRPAVGADAVPGRRAHRARRLAAVRRLHEGRPGRRARRALHDRRAARAGRGRLRDRRQAADLRARRRPAEHRRAAPADHRLLAGRATSRRPARSVRDWARADRERPAPHRYAARIYEDMGALDLAAEAADRATPSARRRRRRVGAHRPPAPAAHAARGRARRARARAPPRPERRRPARPRARLPPRGRRRRRGLGHDAGDPDRTPTPSTRGPATPSRWPAPSGSPRASRPPSDALALGGDEEVAELLAQLRGALPRVLPAA